MNIELKPLREQVVVITGASSGIGLVTARAAADAGASVVLAARNEHDLRDAVHDIRRRGGRATHVAADVSNPADVEALAAAAVSTYGRIDTWVNNAAVAVYGRIMELSLDEMRQQFDINYWGVVHGSRVAVPYLRAAGGGSLINVGSVLSDRAIPLQGNYSAAKHAIKGFTDALRMELEEEGAPISVTLIKPSSIDTPFFDKARSHMGVEPQPVPPVYAPELVADAILAAAVRPVRDVIVGGSGRLMSLATVAPRLTDAYMERRLFDSQKTDKPISGRPDNLFAPVARDGGERGRTWQGRTMRHSATTAAAMHPGAAAMTLVSAAAFAVAAYVRRTRIAPDPARTGCARESRSGRE
jgi:NAD(P)-dependent dehydrogenase (short-subunit alcohol dehydrogenase family)